MGVDGVRRIVTGHDDAGRSVFVEDGQLAGTGLAEDAGRSDVAFFHVWATHEAPVSLSDEALQLQREGCATTTVGTGTGSVLRIGVLSPGSRSPMHRTESLDYGICLEGECELELDGGDVRTIRAGDIVIQRGTNHVWHNRSGAPCRFAWILLDARPYELDGVPLRAGFEH
jgi:quercetin dioxygenase-like cupin family protein